MSTLTQMTMAGVSDLICPNEFRSVSDIVVERSETEMYGDDCDNMGKINYDVFVGNPIGMPFIVRPEGATWEDNGRRTWMFQVNSAQAARLEKALDWAKLKGHWLELYGPRAVTVKMVPGYRKGEPKELAAKRPLYQKII